MYERVLENIIEFKVGELVNFSNHADVTIDLEYPDETDDSISFRAYVLITKQHYSGYVLSEIGINIYGTLDSTGVGFDVFENEETGETYTETEFRAMI